MIKVDYPYPIPVAIAAVIHDNKILLIKRVKDGFEGCWSLPGGKVKVEEHLSETAVREVFEETGIETEFASHLGFVSEHQVYAHGIKHVILHVCELIPKQTEFIQKDEEGELAWFELDNLDMYRDSLIPSDYHMIEKMVKNREKGYYNCIIEVDENSHRLKKFE
jgi:8-oxo-dGTP diphosphatase